MPVLRGACVTAGFTLRLVSEGALCVGRIVHACPASLGLETAFATGAIGCILGGVAVFDLTCTDQTDGGVGGDVTW